MYKLKGNRDACIACGMCALECSVLQEDAEGKVEVVGEGIVADSDADKIRGVVELCPSKALTLTKEYVNVGAKLAELKEKMRQPLTFILPPAEEYRFRLEDNDEYLKEISCLWSLSNEYEYDYNSSSSARSAGERAFRDEIYSQAEAFSQQIIAMYEQRRVNKVARYAEVEGNYKYGVHQRLIKDLRAFVNELESYTGRKISLPSDFFSFHTKDTDYINNRQDHANEWHAEKFKNNLKPASEFYSCIQVEKTYESYWKSHLFGSDTLETRYKYGYSVNIDKLERFYKNVARATWYAVKDSKGSCKNELERFHQEITEEWRDKIDYILREIGEK